MMVADLVYTIGRAISGPDETTVKIQLRLILLDKVSPRCWQIDGPQIFLDVNITLQSAGGEFASFVFLKHGSQGK